MLQKEQIKKRQLELPPSTFLPWGEKNIQII
nr:MAG TPA: WYL1domain protein [Caudoviricetes sp.]